MPGRLAQPGQNGVFLEPFDSRQAADPVTFRQQGQRLQDFMLRGVLAIEDRPSGFGERLPASPTAEALHPLAGFAEFIKVLLLAALKLCVVRASFVWTKISARLFFT